FLANVDSAKGRFRSFLLAACDHFLANERDRASAWKRGGRCHFVPLDFATAEERYRQEVAHALPPEKLFARRWALTLLQMVLSQLRNDYAAKGKTQVFDRLSVCLRGEGEAV